MQFATVALILSLLAAIALPTAADPANERFKLCCVLNDIRCLNMCQHPPPKNMDIIDRICLGMKFASYIHCATGGNDNRECCQEAGVGIGDRQLCLDLCYDSNPLPLPQYARCKAVQNRIAKCNHDSNNQPELHENEHTKFEPMRQKLME